MYRLLFQLVTDPLGLPIPLPYEYLILLILNRIAFRIAWNTSPGGLWGSEIHWAVRIPTFLLMWAMTYAVIWIAKRIYANGIVMFFVSGAVVLLGGMSALVVLKKKRQ